MSELLELDSCRAIPSTQWPVGLSLVVTPLRWREWAASLARHPDHQFAPYITEGIQCGFQLCFDDSSVHCKQSMRNMWMTAEQQEAIHDYLAQECAMRRVVGPLAKGSLPQIQISVIGVIPKGTSGRWRLIVDLSSPVDGSVNDGIDPTLSSLSCVSVRDEAASICHLGRGALLAKVDIRSAYRTVLVHPEDRWLLGMKWNNDLHVDTVLPFGIRSAPKIFHAIADAAEWIVQDEGVGELYHYLDDFLLIGLSNSPECTGSLAILLTTFEQLALPVAPEKLEGPTTRLVFLGIEIDSHDATSTDGKAA